MLRNAFKLLVMHCNGMLVLDRLQCEVPVLILSLRTVATSQCYLISLGASQAVVVQAGAEAVAQKIDPGRLVSKQVSCGSAHQL